MWITCGILWCFYQLFGLSFWRHPFTTKDPSVSKWCNAKCLQICLRNLGWPEDDTFSVFFGWVTLLIICMYNVSLHSFFKVSCVMLYLLWTAGRRKRKHSCEKKIRQLQENWKHLQGEGALLTHLSYLALFLFSISNNFSPSANLKSVCQQCVRFKGSDWSFRRQI